MSFVIIYADVCQVMSSCSFQRQFSVNSWSRRSGLRCPRKLGTEYLPSFDYFFLRNLGQFGFAKWYGHSCKIV